MDKERERERGRRVAMNWYYTMGYSLDEIRDSLEKHHSGDSYDHGLAEGIKELERRESLCNSK